MRFLVCWVGLCVATGCTSTRPVVLPKIRALPAAETAFWNRIAREHSGDWYHVLNRSDVALDWRLRVIDSATVSIDMETFLWKPDPTGRRVLAHLVAAADRGVRVRVLLDDSFTMHEDLALHAIDEHPNIEIRIYNPFRHRSDNAVLRQIFNLGDFSRVNHRMHNKALVVDGQAAIVGGRNIADEYFGRGAAFNFRDLEVLTMGRSVSGVVEHFDDYWNSGWAFPMGNVVQRKKGDLNLADMRRWLTADSESIPVRDASGLEAEWIGVARKAQSGDGYFYSDRPASENPANEAEAPDQLASVLIQLLDAAQTEIILISAYLIPTREFEEAIERAERRGVRVRILTNSLRSNNHLPAHSAYRRHIQRLVSHGADLHEVMAEAADRQFYMQGPIEAKRLGLHAKVMIIDEDRAYVGSCNLDPRSLKLNTEVGLIVQSRSLNRTLRDAFSVDFEPRNAWAVKLSEEGTLEWHGPNGVFEAPPADSPVQRLEDWFLGILPIEGQM